MKRRPCAGCGLVLPERHLHHDVCLGCEWAGEVAPRSTARVEVATHCEVCGHETQGEVWCFACDTNRKRY